MPGVPVISGMDLEEARRMALLEATLGAVRRLNELAKKDATSIPMEEAMDGALLREWRKIGREIDMLLPRAAP